MGVAMIFRKQLLLLIPNFKHICLHISMTYYRISLSKSTQMKYFRPTWVPNLISQTSPLFLILNERSFHFKDIIINKCLKICYCSYLRENVLGADPLSLNVAVRRNIDGCIFLRVLFLASFLMYCIFKKCFLFEIQVIIASDSLKPPYPYQKGQPLF